MSYSKMILTTPAMAVTGTPNTTPPIIEATAHVAWKPTPDSWNCSARSAFPFSAAMKMRTAMIGAIHFYRGKKSASSVTAINSRYRLVIPVDPSKSPIPGGV